MREGWKNSVAVAVAVVVLVLVDAKEASSGKARHDSHHPRMNAKIAEEERRWDLERKCSIPANSRS